MQNSKKQFRFGTMYKDNFLKNYEKEEKCTKISKNINLILFPLYENLSFNIKNNAFKKNDFEQLIKKIKLFLDEVINIIKKNNLLSAANIQAFGMFVFMKKNNKKEILDFMFTKKVGIFKLSTELDIYISNLNYQPKKVIKYLRDGKLKNMRSICGSEVPLRLSNDNHSKHKIIKKEKVLKLKLGNDVDFKEIEKKIKKFRKNFSYELLNDINNILIKHNYLMDKYGSIWNTQSYIGFILGENKCRFISMLDFRNACKKNMVLDTKTEKFFIFGDEVFLKNEAFSSYPVKVAGKTGKQIYFKINGISELAMYVVNVLQNNIRPNVPTVVNARIIFLNPKNVINKKIFIKFNGEISV